MPDAPTDDGGERSSDASKLELPSLRLPGFGRRRARSRSTGAEVESASGETAGDRVETVAPVVEPVAPSVEPVARSVAPPERAAEPVEPAPLVAHAPEPVQPVVEPDESWLEDTALVPEHETARGPASHVAGAPTRRRPELPSLAGGVAALVTGGLVGLAGALLTSLALRGCGVLRGTESCGGGPGVLLLVAILAVMVLLGAAALTALHVSEARSTSLLGVGVLAVAVLLVPQEALFSAWTFLAVPVVGAAAYALARWVTHLHVETPPERGPAHDVR